MNAENALLISSKMQPIVQSEKDNKEYDYIMEQVRTAAYEGKFSTWLNDMPSIEVQKRLRDEGYSFYVMDGGFILPFPFYSISWGKKEGKKNFDWYNLFRYATAIALAAYIMYCIFKMI